jgi:gas vesicle protein
MRANDHGVSKCIAAIVCPPDARLHRTIGYASLTSRGVPQMGDSTGSKISYFMVGLGIGALVGILFAPKSGDETREYLSQRAEEGKEYAQRKARELRERAEDLVERGKQVAAKQKESISAAVDAGREAYQREKSKEM